MAASTNENTTQASADFIVSFFTPSSTTATRSGNSLAQILDFSDNQLEQQHDYIQYLFPLPERSPINPYAPTITPATRRAFLERKELREQLLRGLRRMLQFYGFENEIGTDTHLRITSLNSTKAKSTWKTRMDHNHLRITRIIRCLRVLGCEAEAQIFHQALLDHDEEQRVSQRSRMFWRRAAERPLHLPPEEEDEKAVGIYWLRQEPESGSQAEREK